MAPNSKLISETSLLYLVIDTRFPLGLISIMRRRRPEFESVIFTGVFVAINKQVWKLA